LVSDKFLGRDKLLLSFGFFASLLGLLLLWAAMWNHTPDSEIRSNLGRGPVRWRRRDGLIFGNGRYQGASFFFVF
jgi:hypothetical protein